ncbi:MAG TPA: Hpt domain-containing protein [Hyphomicrobiaceae bacterium]|nr:Hpt domain-containing protein [Hyphomicrobiaceae bacterium]
MNASHSEPKHGHASCPAAPIDFSHLSRYTLGDKALEQEVLALFAAEAPATLGRLRSARTGSAWREAAHTLKGSARAVGARKVAMLAEQAERLCGEGERQELTRGLQQALEEVVRFIASLDPAKT